MTYDITDRELCMRMQTMINTLEDALTWCIEPDKKLIMKQNATFTRQRLEKFMAERDIKL